jgi:hypothetical protein
MAAKAVAAALICIMCSAGTAEKTMRPTQHLVIRDQQGNLTNNGLVYAAISGQAVPTTSVAGKCTVLCNGATCGRLLADFMTAAASLGASSSFTSFLSAHCSLLTLTR